MSGFEVLQGDALTEAQVRVLYICHTLNPHIHQLAQAAARGCFVVAEEQERWLEERTAVGSSLEGVAQHIATKGFIHYPMPE